MHTCNKYSDKKQESDLRNACYGSPCPYCGAAPGEHCRSGGRVYWGVHRSRRPKEKQVRDLSGLWRVMKPWEGEYAKPCPDWLREMFSRAGAA